MNDEDINKAIPKPVGYKVLVQYIKAKETFEGTNIVKPDTEMRKEELVTQVGRVIDMGSDAYTDKEKFPSGPWCQIGDYVLFNYIGGRRIRLGDIEFRLLNDDQIEGIVEDPRFIAQYYMRGI